MPNWDDLRYLLALHRAGSLTRAARLERVDKATVSRRLAALEGALGARLVERLPRGHALTPEGRTMLGTAEQMEALLASAHAGLQTGSDGNSGIVRVTAPIWFARHIIIPALAKLQTRHPRLEVRLVTTNAVLNMAAREADVAVRNLRPTQTGMIARRAGALGSTLYGATKYLEQRGRPSHRRQLRQHHLIGYEERLTYVPSFSWLSSTGAAVAFRASDTLALADAVRAGLGLAVLPCYLGDEEPGVERVEFVGVGREDIYLVTHPALRSVPRVKTVVAWMADLFRTNQQRLAGSEAADAV